MTYPRTFSAHQLPAYQRPGGYYYSQYRVGFEFLPDEVVLAKAGAPLFETDAVDAPIVALSGAEGLARVVGRNRPLQRYLIKDVDHPELRAVWIGEEYLEPQSQYRAGVRASEPGPPPPPSPDEPCGPDMMWDPVLQSCVPVLPWPLQQSSVSHRAGSVSDVTPWGLALPPLGAYQLFGGRGGKDSGWATTFALGAIVLAGVFGYFVYRNLIVAKAGLRGTGRAFGMGD